MEVVWLLQAWLERDDPLLSMRRNVIMLLNLVAVFVRLLGTVADVHEWAGLDWRVAQRVVADYLATSNGDDSRGREGR